MLQMLSNLKLAMVLNLKNATITVFSRQTRGTEKRESLDNDIVKADGDAASHSIKP